MRVLISACLLGVSCRYDGASKPHSLAAALARCHELVPVCPEQLGGLASPREPSARRGGRYYSRSGEDVTAQYLRGAAETWKLAKLFDCPAALMKERSPSCGFGKIYDGSFSGVLIPGNGAAAELLARRGVLVYAESRIQELLGGFKTIFTKQRRLPSRDASC